MTRTYMMDVEYTDTFGGNANYSWVRRARLEIPVGTSPLAVIRRVKASVGLSGVRGTVDNSMLGYEFRPYHCATVLFAHVVDHEPCERVAQPGWDAVDV